MTVRPSKPKRFKAQLTPIGLIITPVWGGRDFGGLFYNFEFGRSNSWVGQDSFGRWVDPAHAPELVGRDQYGRWREVD